LGWFLAFEGVKTSGENEKIKKSGMKNEKLRICEGNPSATTEPRKVGMNYV